MIPIVTADQMRTLDRRTITEAHIPSLTLMERAGAGVVTARLGRGALGHALLRFCLGGAPDEPQH